jgi:hypothetical protein
MKRAYFSDTIEGFLKSDAEWVLGTLVMARELDFTAERAALSPDRDDECLHDLRNRLFRHLYHPYFGHVPHAHHIGGPIQQRERSGLRSRSTSD